MNVVMKNGAGFERKKKLVLKGVLSGTIKKFLNN